MLLGSQASASAIDNSVATCIEKLGPEERSGGVSGGGVLTGTMSVWFICSQGGRPLMQAARLTARPTSLCSQAGTTRNERSQRCACGNLDRSATCRKAEAQWPEQSAVVMGCASEAVWHSPPYRERGGADSRA